jgi:hypothetical protein
MYKNAARFYSRFKAQTGQSASNMAKPPKEKDHPDNGKDGDQIKNSTSFTSTQAKKEKEKLITEMKEKSNRATANLKHFSNKFKAKKAKARVKKSKGLNRLPHD